MGAAARSGQHSAFRMLLAPDLDFQRCGRASLSAICCQLASSFPLTASDGRESPRLTQEQTCPRRIEISTATLLQGILSAPDAPRVADAGVDGRAREVESTRHAHKDAQIYRASGHIPDHEQTIQGKLQAAPRRYSTCRQRERCKAGLVRYPPRPGPTSRREDADAA